MSNYSLKNIEAIANGDETFVASIVDAFKESFANYQKETTHAVAENDYKKIKFLAHQLKPSLDLLEIEAVRTTIRTLETECLNEEGDFSVIASLNNQIITEVTKVIEVMNEQN